MTLVMAPSGPDYIESFGSKVTALIRATECATKRWQPVSPGGHPTVNQCEGIKISKITAPSRDGNSRVVFGTFRIPTEGFVIFTSH
jgi:hypothetical protein